MVFLGDVPAQLARRVLAALAEGARAAGPVCQGRPAHPVGISSALFPAVRALSGDRVARELLQDMSGVEEIATDDAGSTFDIDTLDDHRAAS
ncbi:CTP:molybdopterin cytidylyltransferase MocA [Sphingopyxis panaciterrae]|nr:CTP:molybdopterin cytidylyltransferase MocA [Sphingopyxis panaciterrae]